MTGALATLTARERAVILLRDLFDLAEGAATRDAGISQGSVTSSRLPARPRLHAIGPNRTLSPTH